MRSNRERLFDQFATARAKLASEARWYFANSSPGTLSLEFKYRDELRPARVANSACEVPVLDHIANAQVFDGEHGVSINVPARRLMCMVSALTGHLEVLPRKGSGGLTPPLRAFCTAAEFALRSPEPLSRPLEILRVIHRNALRVGEKHFKPNIDTNSRPSFRLRRISEVADDKGVPVTIGP